MLSERGKELIRGNVVSKYKLIYKSDKNMEQKIKDFCTFLDAYKNSEDFIAVMEKEIEEAAQVERHIEIKKVAVLDKVLDFIAHEKSIEVPNNDYREVFVELNLNEHIDIYSNSLNIPNTNVIESQENAPGGFLEIGLYTDVIGYLFITYMDLAYKMHDEIMNQSIFEEINVKEYLNNIKETYGKTEETGTAVKRRFTYIESNVRKISIRPTNDEAEPIPVMKIINDENIKKIKLIGYAGVGKSTTLKYAQYQDALNYSDKKKIPVLLELIKVNDELMQEKANGLSIYDLIADELNLKDDIEYKIDYLISKNAINLYLDGVNEIAISKIENKRTFLTKLETFIKASQNSNLRIIVVDRDNNAYSVLNDVDSYVIQNMTKTDIEAFIEGNTNPEFVEIAKQKILENKDFAEITMHPLTLTNLIEIIECGKELPTDINGVAINFLQAIVEREFDKKNEPLAIYIDEALKALARRMGGKNSAIRILDILDLFNEIAKGEANALLNLIERMGILKKVDAKTYTFAAESYFAVYLIKN